jgi:TRAP-type mannitol/chloroaromatic compound transport system permease large subunit
MIKRTGFENPMSRSRKRGLIVALIVCLSGAVIVPNILLIVFAGKAGVQVVGLVVWFTIGAIFIGGYFGLYGLLVALTRGPVAPTTLLRLLYKELAGHTSKGEERGDECRH